MKTRIHSPSSVTGESSKLNKLWFEVQVIASLSKANERCRDQEHCKKSSH